MGIATSYHQVLRAQCYPPRLIHPTISTADYHRYSAPIKGRLCRIRPSPDAKLGRTPPFSLFDSSDPNARFAQSYSTNFPTFLPTNITHSSHSTYLILFRLPIAASYAPSDPPKPLYISVFQCGCCQHRCRRISGCFACTITCSL